MGHPPGLCRPGRLAAWLPQCGRQLRVAVNLSPRQLQDDRLPIDEIIADPIAEVRAKGGRPHPRIAQPRAITMPERPTAKGLDLPSPGTLDELRALGYVN